MKAKCRFCSSESERLETTGMSEGYKCPKCGEYEISYYCLATMFEHLSDKTKTEVAKSLASSGKHEIITADYLEKFI